MQLDNKVVGNVIRRKRIQKNMTQEILSGFAGIARTHLTMIENGSKQPNFETIWRIAIALDVKPSELVAEIENSSHE
jgi:transcriptional regulator with XRE-family HTH domain